MQNFKIILERKTQNKQSKRKEKITQMHTATPHQIKSINNEKFVTIFFKRKNEQRTTENQLQITTTEEKKTWME